MCMFLHLSFKKIVQFVLKVVIWPLKAKKWSCRLSLTVAPNTVEKLGIELSFSSSLDTLEDSRKDETLLGYHPTFSVLCCKDQNRFEEGQFCLTRIGNFGDFDV